MANTKRIQTTIVLALVAGLNLSAATQTIIFDPIPGQILGVSPFPITAQASSGLPVTFASTTPAVCKTSGDLVTLLSAGPCFITASQAGNGIYDPASLTRNFTVSRAGQSGALTAAAGSPFPVGSGPYSVVAGDFNGDGLPDFAAVNDGTVTVMLGNGAGGFTAAPSGPFAVGSSPAAIVSGDFNGDGVLDLATANRGSNNVTILLGNGSGGFSAVSSPSVATSPDSIVVGDFNNDGIEDLATANSGSNNVTVLLGDGSGGFTAAAAGPFPAGSFPSAIVAGDFNGDGVQDIATANLMSNNVTVLLGNGTGGFSTGPGSPFAVGTIVNLAVGDFNADGIQDLAAVNIANGHVFVLLGDGTGGFAPAPGSPFATGANPVFVVAGDFNGDGYQDLAVASHTLMSTTANFITVLFGDGSGGFNTSASIPLAAGSAPASLAATDFNNDGLMDLAIANSGTGNVTVLLGGLVPTTSALSTTSPLPITFGQPVPLSLTVSGNTAGFSIPSGSATISDGATVLGTAGQNASPYTFTLTNLGAGAHALTASYGGGSGNAPSTSNTITIQVNQASQTISFVPLPSVPLSDGVMLGATASSFLPVAFASTTPAICTVAGDAVTLVAIGTCTITATQPGNANYLAATPVIRSFTVMTTQTIAFDKIPDQIYGISPFVIDASSSAGLPVTFSSGPSFVCTSAGNLVMLVSPGKCSITASQPGNTLYYAATPVMQQFTIAQAKPSGTLTYSAGSPFTFGNNTVQVAVGDFNGDGIPDFVESNFVTTQVSVTLGDGSGGFSPAPGSPLSVPDAGTLVVGDFNGDGIQDLAVLGASIFPSVPLTVLLGDGSGGFASAPGSPYSFTDFHGGPILAGDFNGDGILDLALTNAASDANNVIVLLGNGSGAFTPSPSGPFPAGNDPVALAAADFNGDGIPDLAVTNAVTNKVTVLLGNGLGGFAAAPGSPFAAGIGPQLIIAGDFNGDGLPDLAIADILAVTVLLGDGHGGFSAAPGSPFAAGGSLVAGDFNGDGHPDLAVADSGSPGNGITLLLGSGSGRFIASPGGKLYPGTSPVSLATADFNGDGIQDLVVGNYNGTVAVLLGGSVPTTSVLSTSSPLTTSFGQPVPLSLTVSQITPGFNPPTGAVTFFDGLTSLGTAAQYANPYAFTASSLAVGTHTLTAAYSGGTGSAASTSNAITIQVDPATQSISFTPLGAVLLSAGTVTLTASASSGLPVSFASTTPAICTVAGDVVTLLSSGQCSIAASQSGNTSYKAATPVTQPFAVLLSQTITFGPLANVTLSSGTVTLAATASSGLTVAYSSYYLSACTVTGSVVTLVAFGTCSITATQPGNQTYAPATAVTQTFVISPQSPSITTLTPNTAPAYSNATPVTIAGSNFLAGATVWFTPPGGSPAPISPTLIQAAQIAATIPASYLTTAGTAQVFVNNGFAAQSNQLPFTVSPATQTISFDPIPNQLLGISPFPIEAQASSGQPVTFASTTPAVCKTAANLVTLLSGGSCSITANSNAATPAIRSFAVNQTKPSGSFIPGTGSPFVLDPNFAPNSVAVGDFNGDGFQDFAVAAYSNAAAANGIVNVYLGNGAGGFTLAAGSPLTVGVGPNSLVAGDFDSDGIQDLAVSNSADGNVTILLGNGSGGFTQASGSPFAAGISPSRITTGDFNGDGAQDLAMVNSAGVTVLLGNGAGGFSLAAGSPYTTGLSPEMVVVGDFNGDGIQDLAVSNKSSNNVSVLLGNGLGVFTSAPGSPFSGGGIATPSALAVGDFNHDGIQDLAVGNYGYPSVSLLLGNGSGAFTPAPGSPFIVGVGPAFIAVGDFNGDGFQDLATANLGNFSLGLVLGDGSGGFSPAPASPLYVASEPQSLAVGDFNGDGILDIVEAGTIGRATVFLGVPRGSTPQTISFGTLSSVRFNDPPFAITATATSGLTVAFTAVGACVVPPSGGSVILPIGVGQCMITANQPGNATFAPAPPVSQILTINPGVQTISFAPLNNVVLGVAPFAISATSSAGGAATFASNSTAVCTVSVAILTIVGGGTCSITASAAAIPYYAAATPVTQTFTVTVPVPALTSVTPNTAPAASPPTAITIAGSNFIATSKVTFTAPGGATASLTPDLIQSAQLLATIPAAYLTTAGTAQVAVSNGSGAVSAQLPFTISPLTQTISFAPIPNQIFGGPPFPIAAKASSGLTIGFTSTTPAVCTVAGDLVAVRAPGTCSITASQAGSAAYAAESATRSFLVSQAKPSGTFTAAAVVPIAGALGLGSRRAAYGDFNGDGITDLVTTNGGINNNLTVLFGNGAGGFTPATVGSYPAGLTPISVVVGDFNRDGIQDLATGNHGTNGNVTDSVTVLLGNGSGGFTSAGTYLSGKGPPGGLPVSIVTADFNGDGIQDLATANLVDGSITLLLGNGSGAFTPATGSPFALGPLGPTSMVTSDFNRDGIPDLAIANEVGSVTVLLGNGLGAFTPAAGSPYIIGENVDQIVVQDVNGDGNPDLAVTTDAIGGTGDNSIAVLLGYGTGMFYAGPVTALATIPLQPVSGDFNGDGIPDLALADYDANSVTVMLGNGSGNFTPALSGPFAVGRAPVSLVAGDFNGDGLLDLASFNVESQDMWVLLAGIARSNSVMTTRSPLTLAAGQSVPLTLTVTPGFSVPTGTATFLDGTTVLGTASQSASPYTFTVASLGIGTHTLTATYGGDVRTSGSASNTITIQVLPAQTIAFSPLPNVPTGTAPITLSATASSGLAVALASTTPTVCTVDTNNTVTILAAGGCSVSATQPGNATYAPAAPVTQTFTVLFTDIAPTDYYSAAIAGLAQRGITAGCGNNSYCALQNVTRDQMAIFVVRAILGDDNFTYTTTPYFTDVQPTTFGFKWIQKLRDLGVTGGCAANTYCPTAVVTRDQMAIFIERARLGVSLAGSSSTFTYPAMPAFTDVPATNFAFPWIQRLKQDNITAGCGATTFCPSSPVTRGDMAIFLMRGAFNQFLPTGTPLVAGISPSTLVTGTSGTYTITGANTNFVQGTTTLSPIPGVTIGPITVTSSTTLTVQLTAASNATPQPYSLIANTGSEQAVLPNGLVLQ